VTLLTSVTMALFQSSLIVTSLLYGLSFAKIYEIYHRDHYHDELQDLPAGSRYASVLAFYNDTPSCQSSLKNLPWTENALPSVEHLFLGQYEFSTSRDRVWYNYEEHLDLPKYLGVEDYIAAKAASADAQCECPILAFVPAAYADALEDDYLRNPSTDGVVIWDSAAQPNWKIWAWQNLRQTVRIQMDLPFDFEVTVNHQTTNAYLSAQGLPWTQTVKVDSLLSHHDIDVFPGDTIYISSVPSLTPQMQRNRKKQLEEKQAPKPTPTTMNPTYMVHAAMYILNVVQFEDDTWGFDDDRIDGLSASFVARRHSTTLMTHTRNLIIPQILPATHSKGFVKIKMPEGLHERLSRFYRKWYHLRAEESWDKSGTQLNFFKVKTNMISLDHDYHERDSIANSVVKPLLLDWAHSNGWRNISALEFTAFYGLREYSEGASLRNHVDRVDTHVFSAILQIAQTGVRTPWPLQVIGFDGVLYDITLEPGEMIMYEGHRLIHGRPYPFDGERYTNAFVHFKPKGWDWTTAKVWKDQRAMDTLKAMHMDMRSIYR